MTHEYGNTRFTNRETVPVASWIWGHRLRQGQDWVEYTLEFLNVLVGYDYVLGQGTCAPHDSVPPKPYRKFSRLGLRRFVFFDGVSGKTDERDAEATEQLKQRLERSAIIKANAGSQDVLGSVQSLLRSFTAVEKQRSWFAKSLFPVHERLLFWEALRKEEKGRAKAMPLPLFGDGPSTSTADLDKGISLSARNFFARGGELYYLMLSAGTLHAPELAEVIGDRLRALLQESSPGIGRLAAMIEETWTDPSGEAGTSTEKDSTEERSGYLGWVPEKDDPLFRIFAQDVTELLQAPLGVTDALTSLSHLMAFHLTLYIYHRAHAVLGSEGSGPTLLLDLLDQDGDNTLRRASSAHFREQEAVQAQAVRAYVAATVEAAWEDVTPDKSFGMALREHTKRWSLGKFKNAPVGAGGVATGKKSATDHALHRWVDEQERTGKAIDRTEVTERLTELVLPDFTKHFLGVHRKLAKSCGFVAPPQGQSARYVMGNDLLKALVLAVTGQARDMEFVDFLQALHDRYGLVVALEQARQSGIFDRHGINADYYQRNQHALLEKLSSAGLATEYSDATALVSGRLS